MSVLKINFMSLIKRATSTTEPPTVADLGELEADSRTFWFHYTFYYLLLVIMEMAQPIKRGVLLLKDFRLFALFSLGFVPYTPIYEFVVAFFYDSIVSHVIIYLRANRGAHTINKNPEV
jgi:hypothetical protein